MSDAVSGFNASTHRHELFQGIDGTPELHLALLLHLLLLSLQPLDVSKAPALCTTAETSHTNTRGLLCSHLSSRDCRSCFSDTAASSVAPTLLSSASFWRESASADASACSVPRSRFTYEDQAVLP